MHGSLPLSRRRLLRYSASALLAANLWPGRLAAAEKDAGSFDFLVVNDFHYINDADGKWLEKVAASMKAQAARAEFLIVAGDLTDNGKAEEFAGVLGVMKALGVPVRTVIGNHDYLPKSADRKAYEQACPDSLNYTFEHRGWQFVGLDTTDGTKANVAVGKPTLDWVDRAVPKLDKDKPTMVFTHFPLGPKVKMRPSNADALLERFKGVNLRCTFGGHYHAYTRTTINDIVLTTNRCCSLTKSNHDGTKEKGYFVCTAREGAVGAKFVQVA